MDKDNNQQPDKRVQATHNILIHSCWIKGSTEPITDEQELKNTDYITCPRSVYDKDVFADALSKANIEFEDIRPSQSGKAWVAYLVGYAEKHMVQPARLPIVIH